MWCRIEGPIHSYYVRNMNATCAAKDCALFRDFYAAAWKKKLPRSMDKVFPVFHSHIIRVCVYVRRGELCKAW